MLHIRRNWLRYSRFGSWIDPLVGYTIGWFILCTYSWYYKIIVRRRRESDIKMMVLAPMSLYFFAQCSAFLARQLGWRINAKLIGILYIRVSSFGIFYRTTAFGELEAFPATAKLQSPKSYVFFHSYYDPKEARAFKAVNSNVLHTIEAAWG